MKKRSYLFILLSFLSIVAYSQEIVCQVCNTSNTPLENVEAKNLNSGKTYYSNDKGFVFIEGNGRDTIRFTSENYSSVDFTINNIQHSENVVWLFYKMQINLSEVTVMPADMYEIFRKAVVNLKNRLIKNNHQAYNCIGVEREINMGSRRGMSAVFTAALKKADPRKEKLEYDFLLSELTTYPDSVNSIIMKDKKCHIFLFSHLLQKDITPNPDDKLETTDSTFVIYRKNSDIGFLASVVINREDTTLIEISSEVASPQKKYRRFRSFSAKELYSSFKIRYKKSKDDDGYYLDYTDDRFDVSFLMGKPQREERLICTYEIYAVDRIVDADLKFKPKNNVLYKMKGYNSGEQK